MFSGLRAWVISELSYDEEVLFREAVPGVLELVSCEGQGFLQVSGFERVVVSLLILLISWIIFIFVVVL